MLPFFHSPTIEALEDSLQAFVLHQALVAPFVLLFIEESGIPLPVPGDVYLAFMGYQVSKGNIPYIVALIIFLISVLAGSSILYYISARWGHLLMRRLGLYLDLNEKKLLQFERNFKKYGIWVIIFGRHIPGFRVPITVFSGISGVPYRTFLFGTFISVVFWIAFYLAVGERLGKSVLRHFHATPLYFAILCIPFIFFICWILYVKLKSRKSAK